MYMANWLAYFMYVHIPYILEQYIVECISWPTMKYVSFIWQDDKCLLRAAAYKADKLRHFKKLEETLKEEQRYRKELYRGVCLSEVCLTGIGSVQSEI